MAMHHAYFLHTRPYRESSLLVDIFTAEQGRISGVFRSARGGRKATPQLFQPLMLEVSGTGDLKTLRQAETTGLCLPLAGTALFSAFYLNELLTRLLPREEKQTELFVRYVETLVALSEQYEPAPLLRQFECLLLEVLGYAIDFSHDSDSGEAVVNQQHYGFHPERGFFPTSPRMAVATGDTLYRMADGNFEQADAARAAKQINRLALAKLLGNRPLKSRELFLTMRGEQ